MNAGAGRAPWAAELGLKNQAKAETISVSVLFLYHLPYNELGGRDKKTGIPPCIFPESPYICNAFEKR